MIYTFVLHPQAEKEYIKTIAWYEKRQIGLGKRYNQAIKDKLALIQKDPLKYPVTQRDFREAVVQDFPFVIVFYLNGSVFYVSSIFHTSRDPKRKFRRFK